jgi:hypothetical protein
MNILNLKYIRTISAVICCTAGMFASCTNLDETVFSEITSENYYKNADEVLAAYLSVYAPLQDVWEEDYFNITEFSTDEALRPTRVQHGYDGGQWIRFHRHQWLVEESRIGDVWNKCFKGIGFANICLSDFKNMDFDAMGVRLPRARIEAELRAMRAFYYYLLIDLFGGVPVVTTVGEPAAPARNTRKETADFIESELKAVIDDLPAKGDVASYGKMTKGGAHAILAKLYLNAEEWTGVARWSDCVAACNAIINTNEYQLDAHWQDPFHYFNEGSVENIFVVPYDHLYGTKMNYPGRFLHYAHKLTFLRATNSSNGVCTEIGFFSKFSPNDKRYEQWLVGPQYGYDGVPLPCVFDLMGQDLLLDPVISKMEDGAENSGVRNVKFKIQLNTTVDAEDNDVPVFRYADVLMMKAECLLRTENKPDALTLINQVRARCFEVGDPDKVYTDITMDEFLDERAREFAYECYRRQDLIRFGKFNDAWWDKPATQAYLKLFPIPDSRVKANPNMKQNPGYE